MQAAHLWLGDFRNYAVADITLAEGLTVVTGDNGEGKTNLLEAVGYLSTLSSFRGVPGDAMIRAGATSAIVRAEIRNGDRSTLVEAELRASGRDRVRVNRQPLRRTSDLTDVIRVSVFTPDDLVVVKGGPAERRRLVDGVLSGLHLKWDALQHDVERVLRQRNALLRQAGGHLGADVATTLDVWDAKLAEVGEALAVAREEALVALEPAAAKAYAEIAGAAADVSVSYRRSWSADLASALASARTDDLRRGVTTVGPHRDEIVVDLDGLPARTHASQGEQRCLALAFRLAGHRLVADAAGDPPVLLLDDVFSELDPARSEALLLALPPGQALLTTAGAVPPAARPELRLRVRGGQVRPE